MRWLLLRRLSQTAVLLAFALAPPQIVSGTLLSTTTPQVLTPVISINQDNTYTPATFQNLRSTPQKHPAAKGAMAVEDISPSARKTRALNPPARWVETGGK